MEIKQYDMIEYKGELCRVMDARPENHIKISPHGWVPISEVQLIESVIVPIFSIGDNVLINGIDRKDEDEYSATWLPSMDELIDTESTIEDVNEEVGIYLLSNGFWFAPYHLEKDDQYDMF